MDVDIKHAGAAPETSPGSAGDAAPARIDPNAPTVVTDGKGRKITLQRPELLAEFRFVQAAGPELAANQTWIQMAMQVIYVKEIDDRPVTFPKTSLEIEALIKRLGHDGFNAIAKWVTDLAEQARADANKDQVKNF